MLLVGGAAVLGAAWFSRISRPEVWAQYVSPAGLTFSVSSEVDWEVSQPVDCCVTESFGPTECRSVAYGRPEDNALRQFQFLTTPDGSSVAILQTFPERKVLALFEQFSGELWAFHRNSEKHRKLWHEIARANGVDSANR